MTIIYMIIVYRSIVQNVCAGVRGSKQVARSIRQSREDHIRYRNVRTERRKIVALKKDSPTELKPKITMLITRRSRWGQQEFLAEC